LCYNACLGNSSKFSSDSFLFANFELTQRNHIRTRCK